MAARHKPYVQVLSVQCAILQARIGEFRYNLDLLVTYPETKRRCRGVRVGPGPAAPMQTKPYWALFAQQVHHYESERDPIWN